MYFDTAQTASWIIHPDCFSGGRYCAPDPDMAGPRSGKDIVEEDLRQMCIFNYTRKNEKTDNK